MPEFENLKVYDDILEFAKQNAIFNLLEAGVDESFFKPMMEKLNTAYFASENLDDLVDELKIFTTGGKEGVGALQNHVSKVSSDSLTQFNATYNQAITKDLGIEFYKYTGTKIAKTRQFCIHYMNGYFHKKEVEQMGGGIDPLTGKSLSTLQLTQGRIKGTNKSTIFINRGGWNCRHYFSPISSRFVPKNVLQRNAKNGNWKPTKREKAFLGDANGGNDFFEQKTLKEAEEFAIKSGLAKKVDYSSATLEQANNVNRALIESNSRLKPDLKGGFGLIKFVDDADFHANATGGNLIVNQKTFNNKTLKKHSVGLNEQKNQALERINTLEREIEKLAGDDYQKTYINRLKKEIELKKTLLKELDDVVEFSNYSDNMNSVIKHEHGHLINRILRENTKYTDEFKTQPGVSFENIDRSKLMFRLDDIAKNEGQKIGQYATRNAGEYFAEAWVAYLNGDLEVINKELLNVFKSISK